MRLTRLAGTYAVARAAAATPVPEGLLDAPGMVSVTRTPAELSIAAEASALEGLAGLEAVERGWTAFAVEGPLDFGLVGVVADLSRCIAEAGLGIFVVSTYDTDIILVKTDGLERAVAAWRTAGHEIA